jgi:hypothetical protein
MHSVCWILTVAAKEVAARAAMVAKVKPFILMVLWCWGVVVWCSVKEGNGSEGGKNRLDLEATANVGVSVLVVVVVGEVVVVIEVVVSGVMVVFQLRVSIPYKLSPTSTQHSSPPEIAAAAACGEDPLLHSCALPFAHPRIGSRATLKQRRLARERGRRTLVHRLPASGVQPPRLHHQPRRMLCHTMPEGLCMPGSEAISAYLSASLQSKLVPLSRLPYEPQ